MTLEELVRSSEASRSRLAESHARFRRTVDFPARVRSSLREAPAKWLGGSLVAGFVASFLLKGRKSAKAGKPKHRRGMVAGLLAMGFAFAKPFAKAYAAKLLKDYLAARLLAESQARFARGTKPPY